jgi:hypothetical protein
MAQDNLGNDRPKAYLPLGHIDAIENKEREEGEPVRWARVRLQHSDGSEGTFLFTFEEMKNAMIRAELNKEDLPPKGFLQRLQDLID